MKPKLKWSKTEITKCYELQVDRFASDFPHYSEFVSTHGLNGKGSVILAKEGVERVKNYFDVSITLHNPGMIFDDLRQMGKAAMENRHGSVEGFMSPEYRGSDKFYIALTAFHGKSVIPIATLIHELGHLVEEQVRLDTNEIASEAFNNACDLLLRSGMAVGDGAHFFNLADEWVAWVNSIWICKLLDIEIRHPILGMTMDETAWRGNHNNIVTRSMAKLVDFVTTRHFVRHRLLTAATVSSRCSLINEMSAHFFSLASKYMPHLFSPAPLPKQANQPLPTEDAIRCKNNIEAGLRALANVVLQPVPADRMPDCLQLISELDPLDITISPKQVHLLWMNHSARFAVPWARPRQGNAVAIEVEAMKFVKAAAKTAELACD